jgi:outer membrane protein assembly factor BamB
MRKRWLIAIAAGVLLLAAGLAAAAFVVWKERHPGTIRGSASTEFDTTAEPGTSTRPELEVQEIPWPTFGYDEQRTKYASAFNLHPPFRTLWERQVYSLVEFPPVVAYGRLYVATNGGRLLALSTKTGKVAWIKRFDRCTAASPAVGDGVVYQPFMDTKPCGDPRDSPGFIAGFDADTGRELWRFRTGVIETSPLLIGKLLYFGSWDRKLYALDVETHKVVWTFTTGDEIKAAPAYDDGMIYFASYDNKVYAVDARTGKLRWSAEGTANFYATPAVAYGRVFIGNTDGRVYAFGAPSGHLLWAKATGGYVYSSAAVWQKKVYVGSWSKRFYALDAGSGDTVWSFPANGPISGAATVLDGVVYFSTTAGKTYALDAQTGRKLWEFDDGKYTPIVADEKHVYLSGYKTIYGLAPGGG